jgi:hypothetical protein
MRFYVNKAACWWIIATHTNMNTSKRKTEIHVHIHNEQKEIESTKWYDDP